MKYQIRRKTLEKLTLQTELMYEGDLRGYEYVNFNFENCSIENPGNDENVATSVFFDGLSKDEFLLTVKNDDGFVVL